MVNEWLSGLTAWYWLGLGLLLLVFELLGAGGFLLGAALASIIVGFVMLVSPDWHWHWQFVTFAILAVAFTVIYWKRFRHFNEATDQPLLNDCAAQMIGKRFTLVKAIENGTGKIQVGDTFWSVTADTDIPAETTVTITGAEGMTLRVKPTDSTEAL